MQGVAVANGCADRATSVVHVNDDLACAKVGRDGAHAATECAGVELALQATGHVGLLP